ncbi:putative HNHc nuclease [Ligilactobacillus salivarius]|uniref:putative HNHc nuclease n=1 Tax=Ligilactobacillus salivarius TaxID=1624 RepID=UPI00136C299B|nr:putative HNHc nuclease [Ligilactobacillus salivarius]MYY55277.1 hypothetical protein [Ligilactobacillus salivarius]
MFGKLIGMQGNVLKIALDEDLDIAKVNRLANGKQPTVELKIADNRKISPEQRKKIFALINDLCSYTGDVPEYWESVFKYQVRETFGIEEFSLADCSVTVANYMILVILNFLFEEDIPFKTKTWDSLPNEFPKMYLCLKNRKCFICGKKADICHANAVGMGRNRNKIDHRQFYFFACCRRHHNESHTIGLKSFLLKYHFKPIKLSEKDLIDLKIMTKKGIEKHDG